MSDKGWLWVAAAAGAFAFYRHRLGLAPGAPAGGAIRRGDTGPATAPGGDPSKPGNFPYGE